MRGFILMTGVVLLASVLPGILSAQDNGILRGQVVSATALLADSSSAASPVQQLAAGAKVTIFPEMSSDDFFFVMTDDKGKGYGWVPTADICMVDSTFGDVPQGHWAGEALRRLENEGLIEGDGKGFRGNQAVTRYELAMIMDRYLDKLAQFKGSIMASIEALPLDTTLEGDDASRLDHLVKTLENAESTEKHIRSEIAKLSEAVEDNSQRLDVVEELQASQTETIYKMEKRIEGNSSRLGRVNGMEKVIKSLQNRIARLENGVFPPKTSAPSPVDLGPIRRQLKELRERMEQVESVRSMAKAPAAAGAAKLASLPGAPAPDVNDDPIEEDLSLSEEDFDMGDDFAQVPVETARPKVVKLAGGDGLKRKAEQAHDALRAALRRGLLIRHPVVALENSDIQAPKPDKPNQILVKALTRQIGEISQSLRSIDQRIDSIEQGVMD